MKNFLYQLVGRLHIDSDSTRVGLVVYSTKVDSEKSFYLNSYSSVKAVQSAISSIRHLEGNTNTSGAFAYVRTTILTSAGGARSNMPNIVVVFTDGRPNYPLSTLVSIHMFVCIDMLLLGDIVEIDYAYCYRCSVAWSVCLSVCHVHALYSNSRRYRRFRLPPCLSQIELKFGLHRSALSSPNFVPM